MIAEMLCLLTAAAPAPASSFSAPRMTPCATGVMTVHFYDVGQALAVLVDLPDGRHILVDTGESRERSGCGAVCKVQHANLMQKLERDLHGDPLDLLFVTHQHSDHIGGAPDVLQRFVVKRYVDNGRNLDLREVQAARAMAAAKGVPVSVIAPGAAALPLQVGAGIKVKAIAPSRWLDDCDIDRNHCSIMLRIDYCASSLLLSGDEEVAEEALFEPLSPVTLLQVGHHGSETSSGLDFLRATRPKYAVISVGKQGEGMNRGFCHPRASAVRHLAGALGGPLTGTVHAFESQNGKVECRCTKRRGPCRQGTAEDWVDVPVGDNLWSTARDGDIVLTTQGNGLFARKSD